MSEKLNFAKNSGWTLFGNFFVLAISFIFRPIIARLLGTTQYSIFALILSTATVISAYSLLQLHAGISFYTSKEPEKAGDFVSTALFFLFISSLVIFFPAYLLINFILPVLSFEAFLASFVLAIGLSLLHIVESTNQGLFKFKNFTLVVSSSTLIAGILSVSAAFFTSSGALTSLLRAIGIILISIFGLTKLNEFGKASKKTFQKLWSYSRPLAFAGLLSTLIAVVDKYFIAAFAQLESVAPYDISLVLVTALLPFGVSLANVMMPSIARDSRKALSYYPRIAAANAAFLTLAGLTLYYYADIVINLLVGEAYLVEGAGILRVLALALPVMGFKNLNALTFQGLGETKRAAFYGVSLVGVNVVLNALLVPAQGALGAATATLLTYLIVLSASTFDLRSRVGVGVKQSVLQLGLFAGFAAAYWLFEEPGFILKTLCLAAFAFATLALQRKLVGEVIETVKSSAFFGGKKK